jgi:hypothetical protein
VTFIQFMLRWLCDVYSIYVKVAFYFTLLVILSTVLPPMSNVFST